MHRLCSWITAFLPQSPPLLALDCHLIRVPCTPLFSTAYLLPSQRPSTIPLTFRSSAASGFCWFPVMPLCTCFVPRLQSAVPSPSLEACCGCPLGQVCTVSSYITCLGARCLRSNWGLEVPGHPVLGSLHSSSTWRKVSFGWFPHPGLPWIASLWLMAFAPR